MIKEFQKNFIQIDDIFYSPYFKLNKKYSSLYFKNLRKPNTGMFNLAKKKWPVDKKRLVMIGDKKLDYQFGKKIRAKTIIIDENLDIFKQIKKRYEQKRAQWPSARKALAGTGLVNRAFGQKVLKSVDRSKMLTRLVMKKCLNRELIICQLITLISTLPVI